MSKKLIKKIPVVVLILSLLTLSACSHSSNNKNTAPDTGNNAQRTETQASDKKTEDPNTIYGKVTAINGNDITLSLGTLNVNRPVNGKAPDKNNKSKNGNEPSPNTAKESSGVVPDLLTFTGEIKKITVSDDNIITRVLPDPGKGNMPGGTKDNTSADSSENSSDDALNQKGETAVLSDITKGCYLKVSYDSKTGKPSGIEILRGTDEMPGGSAASSSSTDEAAN